MCIGVCVYRCAYRYTYMRIIYAFTCTQPWDIQLHAVTHNIHLYTYTHTHTQVEIANHLTREFVEAMPLFKGCRYARIHSCTHTFMHTHIHAHIHSCTYTFMHTYIHAHMDMQLFHAAGMHTHTERIVFIYTLKTMCHRR